MPKRTDIKKVLVIGSGPIIIGQAAEFDYAGTQACLALKEEGYEVIESEYSRSVYKYANDENFILVVSVDYTDSFLNYERRVSDEFLEQSVSA